jgi:hypothetical protein
VSLSHRLRVARKKLDDVTAAFVRGIEALETTVSQTLSEDERSPSRIATPLPDIDGDERGVPGRAGGSVLTAVPHWHHSTSRRMQLVLHSVTALLDVAAASGSSGVVGGVGDAGGSLPPPSFLRRRSSMSHLPPSIRPGSAIRSGVVRSGGLRQLLAMRETNARRAALLASPAYVVGGMQPPAATQQQQQRHGGGGGGGSGRGRGATVGRASGHGASSTPGGPSRSGSFDELSRHRSVTGVGCALLHTTDDATEPLTNLSQVLPQWSRQLARSPLSKQSAMMMVPLSQFDVCVPAALIP